METWQIVSALIVVAFLIWFTVREYLRKTANDNYNKGLETASQLMPKVIHINNNQLQLNINALKKARRFATEVRNNKYQIPSFEKPHINSLFEDKIKRILTLFNDNTFKYFPIDPVVKTLIDSIDKEDSTDLIPGVNRETGAAIFDAAVMDLDRNGWRLPSNKAHNNQNTPSNKNSAISQQSSEDTDSGNHSLENEPSDKDDSFDDQGDNDYGDNGNISLEHHEVEVDLDHPHSNIIAGGDIVIAKVPSLDIDLLDFSLGNVEIDIDIPGLTLLRSIYREGKLINSAKIDMEEAARRVGLDVLGTGAGITIGNIAGALMFVEPVTGFIITAITGIIGRLVSDSYKKKPLTKAYELYKDSYNSFEKNRNVYIDNLLNRADNLLKEASKNYSTRTTLLGKMPIFDEDNQYLSNTYNQLLDLYENDRKEAYSNIFVIENTVLNWQRKIKIYNSIFFLSIDNRELQTLVLELKQLKELLASQARQIKMSNNLPLIEKIDLLLKFKYFESDNLFSFIDEVNESIGIRLKHYSSEIRVWAKSYDNTFVEIINIFRSDLQTNMEDFNVKYFEMIKSVNANKDAFINQKTAFGMN